MGIRPLAFSGLSSFKSFAIPFFVNLNSFIGGACSPLTSGVLPSSVENTLENCLFNNSAISSSFVYVVSPSTNGVAPTMSDFFDLMKEKNRFLFVSPFSETLSLI